MWKYDGARESVFTDFEIKSGGKLGILPCPIGYFPENNFINGGVGRGCTRGLQAFALSFVIFHTVFVREIYNCTPQKIVSHA